MCIERVTTDFIGVPVLGLSPLQNRPRSSESRVFQVIRNFFLGCTAVSGIAFAVTGWPGALTACILFGAISFSLIFPSSGYTVRTRTLFDGPVFMPEPRRREPTVVVVDDPFARHNVRDERRNRREVVQEVRVADPFERHIVRDERPARREVVQEARVVADPFERHVVGGGQGAYNTAQEFDPFERHQVGKG